MWAFECSNYGKIYAKILFRIQIYFSSENFGLKSLFLTLFHHQTFMKCLKYANRDEICLFPVKLQLDKSLLNM